MPRRQAGSKQPLSPWGDSGDPMPSLGPSRRDSDPRRLFRGTKRNPTYHDLGDHSETVQIDFDPTRLSYEQLLDVFWKAHDSASRSWSRQYRAALFFHNEGQKRSAQESRDREAARIRGKVQTEILPAAEFYPAEDYHQKYYLRQDFVLSTSSGRCSPPKRTL